MQCCDTNVYGKPCQSRPIYVEKSAHCYKFYCTHHAKQRGVSGVGRLSILKLKTYPQCLGHRMSEIVYSSELRAAWCRRCGVGVEYWHVQRELDEAENRKAKRGEAKSKPEKQVEAGEVQPALF